MLQKIISGGQTGADRAALDWALANPGIEHGGWCPLHRLSEDGRIDDCYLLEETPHDGYSQRTEWNVRDSDGTVIFSIASELTGGSLFTLELARKWNRPFIHISQKKTENPAETLRQFVDDHFVETLNIAGPRISGEPEIGEFVRSVLDDAFSALI